MARLTVRRIEEQLAVKRGNVAATARALGVHRTTIHRRIQKSPVLQAALEEARETMLDNAERQLYDEALDGNTAALIFFLKTQGKSRGYTERHELTGADGKAVHIILSWGDDADA
jgi:hypothetical protein